MRGPNIDEPIKLGWGFLVIYLITLGLLLGFVPPWKWQAPFLTEAIGTLLFPFLGALAVYCMSLFVFAIATNLSGQLRGLALFSIEVAALLVAMAAVYAFPNLKRPSVFLTMLASIVAGSLLRFIFRAKPNQSTDPAFASGTSRAEHEPRHR
jgi:hypothetical protein